MESQDKGYKGHLLLFNVGKRKNYGTLVRSACAFGIDKVYLISNSQKKNPKPHKEFSLFGNQGTTKETEFEWFNTLTEAKEYFVKNNIFVCGIEIMSNAEPVSKHPFRGSTVFMVGNEGTGLNVNQKKICDHYVYIPQYTDKTASLNIAIAGSIVFHHFALWAQFKEAPIYGEKFKEISNEAQQEVNEDNEDDEIAPSTTEKKLDASKEEKVEQDDVANSLVKDDQDETAQ